MSFSEVLQQLVEQGAAQALQGMVGKVEQFDADKMRAKVQPLYKIKLRTVVELRDFPVLEDIPVLFHFAGGFFIKPTYEAGDMVWVSFATYDIDDALKEQAFELSPKTFGAENCCVTGGVAKTGWSAPTDWGKDGMLIGHKDGNTLLQIESDKITMYVGSTVKMEITSTGLKLTHAAGFTTLQAHTHTSASPGVPTSPPIPGT